MTSGKEGVKEVAGHPVFKPTSTGNARYEFIENQAIPVTAAELS